MQEIRAEVPATVIAAELRVSEWSVRRWRQAWLAGGEAGLASCGQAAQCRLDELKLAALDLALEAGPLAAGWEDQRWTLARVGDLVASKFRVSYTIAGMWYLPQRRGWTCQIGVDEAASVADLGTARDHPGHPGPRRRHRARLGRRAGLLPARVCA